jgi:hypothetical protein
MKDRIEHWGRHACVLATLVVVALAGCKSEGTKAPAADQAATGKPSGYTQKTATPSEPTFPQGFTCCNLHYDGDWISDSNYATSPMIPVGTPAKVTKYYSRYRTSVDIGGKPMRLGLDYGRKEQTLQQWTEKIVVADDPKIKIATFPPAIQNAIKQGKLSKGMTKEQVIMSVGYPLTSENSSLDAPVWRMWVSSWEEYQVLWGSDGLVKDITGDPAALTLVVYNPALS